MFKLFAFFAVLAVALAAPQPGVVAPVAYSAGYTAGFAAPVAYSGYSGYSAPLVRSAYASPYAYAAAPVAAAYSAPVVSAYSAPYATYY